MLEFHPSNPFRVVSWRWERAGDVVEGGPPASRRRDDPWVHRAVRLRAGLAAAQSRSDLAVLMLRDPPVYWAHEAWREREHPSRRIATHGLEARLLATMTPAEAAARGALDAAAVEAYGQLYFDVAGRHDQVDYVASMVLGPAIYTGLQARDYDLLWKLLGWGYGPAMVDLLMTKVAQRMRITEGGAAAVMAAVADDAAATLKVNAMVAAKTLRINSFNVTHVMQMYLGLIDIERQGGKDGGTQQTILTNVQAMMGVLPFRVGAAPPPDAVAGRAAPPRLAAYDRGAAELSGREILRLGAGQEIDLAPDAATTPFRALAAPAPPPAAAP